MTWFRQKKKTAGINKLSTSTRHLDNACLNQIKQRVEWGRMTDKREWIKYCWNKQQVSLDNSKPSHSQHFKISNEYIIITVCSYKWKPLSRLNRIENEFSSFTCSPTGSPSSQTKEDINDRWSLPPCVQPSDQSVTPFLTNRRNFTKKAHRDFILISKGKTSRNKKKSTVQK